MILLFNFVTCRFNMLIFTAYLLHVRRGRNATQLYRDRFRSHEIRIPVSQPGFNGMSQKI